jgi:hypothetical protein
MKQHSFVLLPLVFLASCLTAGADEIAYPKQSYDVTYAVSRPVGGTADIREACDGKGHELWCTPGPADYHHLYSVITDYLNKVQIILRPDKKQFTKISLDPNHFENRGFNKGLIQVTKTPGVKELGAETVEGHPCHGFEVTHGDHILQIWIADEEKIVVRLVAAGPTGHAITLLKAWSTNPPASAFEVPADYKQVDSFEQTPQSKIDVHNQ